MGRRAARQVRRAPRAVPPRAPPERDMSVFPPPPRDDVRAAHVIEIVEPDPAACEAPALPPDAELCSYRLLSDNLRAYSPDKGKLARYDVCATISPPRARILELLRPDDPGRDALEAIMRPAPRRLSRPLDDDTRRFLQRALQVPSPLYSMSTNSESHHRPPESGESETDPEPAEVAEETSHKDKSMSSAERSLADELREAEEEQRVQEEECGGREVMSEMRRRGAGRDAVERERLGRLALAVEDDEQDECPLSATARRLDALLAQSRDLHHELLEIHEDLQVLARRTARPRP